MRNARTLLAELRLWKTMWQQVETFQDHIDNAADLDGVHYRRMVGLLRAARAIEHERARAEASRALGDPVITALPTSLYQPKDDTTVALTPTGAWDDAKRRWRLPGTDEVELAVALLGVDLNAGEILADENVTLPPPVSLFQLIGDDGVSRPLRLPSYPGPVGATIAEGPLVGAAGPSIKDVGGRISLFPRDARRRATLGESNSDTSPVTAWSALCRARRGAGRGGSGDDLVALSSFRSGPPWGAASSPLQQVLALGAGIAATPAGVPVPLASLDALRAAAATALGAMRPDAEDLVAAAAMVSDDGLSDPRLGELLTAAGTAAQTRLTSLSTIDTAASALRAAPTSSSLRTQLASAITALAAAALPAGLFGVPVEENPQFAAELDREVAARVAYPDGTLRGLRTLESGFVAAWPHYRRWFVLRHAGVLAPAMAALREPFVTGLRALLQGGFTGLAAEGLTLGAGGAAIGADQVDLDLPASLVEPLAGALEPGQVGVIEGDRPAAVVILGISARLGHASLNVSPLRLDTASPAVAPGPVGLLPAGSAITRWAPTAMSDRELRRGRSDAGPGHDAPVREALSLFGRLSLVFGADVVERWLQGLPAGAPLPHRLIPEVGVPPTLYGSVPGYATTLVLHGLGPAFWAQPGVDGAPAGNPEPRVARPGELLLLRGRTAGDGDAPGPLIQAPVDVDDVFAITGDALARMDTSRVGMLSTSPDALPPGPTGLVCGPDEPLAVVLLRRSWCREELTSQVSLHRRAVGFDAASLAARTLLPLDLVGTILGSAPPDVPGVGRAAEFAAALDILDEWTRHGG